MLVLFIESVQSVDGTESGALVSYHCLTLKSGVVHTKTEGLLLYRSAIAIESTLRRQGP